MLFGYLFACSLVLLFIFARCNGKEEKIYGRWRLQTVFMNGDTLNDSLQFNVIPKITIYNFFLGNSLTIKTYIMGISTTSSDGYYSFKNNSTINMKYTILYQSFDITAKIKKLTQKELNLEYEDKGNKYFLILYPFY
ncbi:MAG: hypothetical protein FWF70_07335 [Bacteroidetes bacterium]|nr:hypothetical protein [Bacteroidota bacterium]MCL1968862.1 hypothetical protein [Bacteroidota bacterium]